MLAPASLPAALDLRRSRGLLYREGQYRPRTRIRLLQGRAWPRRSGEPTDEGRSAAGRFQYCQVAEIQDGRRGFVGVRSQHRQSERMMSAKRTFSAFGSRDCGGIDCRLEAIHQH